MPNFTEFIDITGEDPLELLKRRSWTTWKAMVGRASNPADPDLQAYKLHLALVRAAMQRAPRYLDWLNQLSQTPDTGIGDLVRQPFAELAYQLLWNRNAENIGVNSLDEAFRKLLANRSLMSDLGEVVEWAKLLASARSRTIVGVPVTLELHGLYSVTEINAAFGTTTFEGGGMRGTGVIHYQNQKVVAHLVTFEKNEKQFSESTMYRDFATAPDLLHWESQSVATQQGTMGRIYANHREMGYRILFFTRIRKEAINAITSPFLFLGSGNFLDATGNRPIAIRWQLDHPMPMAHFREARTVCGLDS